MGYENWKKGDPITYKKAQAEDFSYVPPKGNRHDAFVPDTVDIAEMARLSVHAMTSVTDPDADHEIYFWLLLDGKTPYMRHDNADMCIMKFQESLPLMRILSGSTENEDVEKKWMENTLKSIGDDGHIYECYEGRPWWIPDPAFPDKTGDPDADRFGLDPAYSGRFLSAMVLYYRRSGDEIWKTSAIRLVDALLKSAIDKGTYCYFSPSTYLVRDGYDGYDLGRDEPQIGNEARHPMLGALHVYREFGYAPALELSRKLLAYLMDELKLIADDGEYKGHANFVKASRCFEFMGTEAHVHAHTSVLHYALEYTLVSGDQTYLDRVLKGYDYAKVQGQEILGFFGEYFKSTEFEEHETCELADLIAIAIKLSEAGIRDCYNDVDLWLRNLGREGQLTPDKAAALKSYAATMPYDSPVEPNYGYDNAVDRNIGGFCGWATGNNFFHTWEKHVIMHCCTGNMTRALYYAWKGAARYNDGGLTVNLLLNLETPDVAMASYIPYSGKVEITPRKDCAFFKLRLPDWAKAEDATLTVNGTKKAFETQGQYLVAKNVKAGDLVVFDAPIPEKCKYIWVEKEKLYITMRGNDVIDIQPKGRECPLFNRGHYAGGEVRYKKVSRFITSEEVEW